MADAKWFGGRLRELRATKGWGRKQLADLSGIQVNGIRDIEQGINSPRWTTVVALCAALGVGPEEFMKPPTAAPPEEAEAPATPPEPAAKGKRKGSKG